MEYSQGCCRETGKMGLCEVSRVSTLSGIRKSSDEMEDGSRISKETARHFIRQVATNIVALYGEQYENRFQIKMNYRHLQIGMSLLVSPDSLELWIAVIFCRRIAQIQRRANIKNQKVGNWPF